MTVIPFYQALETDLKFLLGDDWRDQIADPKDFKNTYRDQLDAAGWKAEERERVIDEVVIAYSFNTELFHDLSAAKAAA